MALLHSHILLLLSLALLLHYNDVAMVNGDRQFITQTCNSTPISSECTSVLVSNPSTCQATDVKGLVSAVVNMGIAKAIDTITFIHELLSNATDDLTKQLLSTCEGSYSSATSCLSTALKNLDGGDTSTVLDYLNKASGEAVLCEEAFTGHQKTYPPEIASREQSLMLIDRVAGNLTQLLGKAPSMEALGRRDMKLLETKAIEFDESYC